MSKYHLLPHKQAARFAVEKKLFKDLEGIVKCWQAWSSQQTKGSPNIGDIKIREPKALMLRIEKRADLKTQVVPFLIALVCANLRPFCATLRLFCA